MASSSQKKSSAARTTRKSNGKTPKKAPQKQPIRREVTGGVLLVLALFVLVSYFGVSALFLDFFSKLLKGLFGYGYWLAGPSLVLAGLILLIIVGTLPLFAVLPIKDAIEGLGDNMYFVAFALLATGCLLFASDRVRRGRKTERSAAMLDALLVGVGQAVATCPGISRSGTTITAGCFVGFERKFAVRYSFLMSIPAILGANLLSLKDALEAAVPWEEVPVYLVGVAVSALVGYACIRLIKLVADKGKFGFFAYYCWLAGIVTLALIFTQK